MAIFEYKGYDSEGRKVSGSCEGSSQRSVLASLREKGIFASEVVSTKNHSGRNLWQQLRMRQVPTEELAVATRQLSTLLSAGLSLDLALASVAEQTENQQLVSVLERTREAVIQGEALHSALSAERKIFPAIYLSMTEVGESSGTLDLALANLADLLEEQTRLRSRINAAMAYPLLMAVAGTGVLLFLVGFVLPRITRMLLELEQVLPLPTRILIAASNLLQNYGWLLTIVLVVALLLFKRWSGRDKGRFAVDRWKLRLSVIGRLNLLIATSRFSRTLSTLLGSGLPLLQALEITGKLLNNKVLEQHIDDASHQIREGSTLTAPLQKAKLFPVMLTQMVSVGEDSGELEQMLRRVANNCDQQIELSINRMLALLEPIMILIMGGAVGFIVLAILLPIFQASQSLH